MALVALGGEGHQNCYYFAPIKYENLHSPSEIADFINEDEILSEMQKFSSWNDHSGALKPAYMSRPLRCYAYVMDKGNGICLRANNLHSYVELNKKVDRILPSVAPNVEFKLLHPSSNINTKSQVKLAAQLRGGI